MDGKGLAYQTEELLIILIFTSKRKMQLIEFMSCKESQRRSRQSRDLDLGLWAPRQEGAHDHGTKMPAPSPFRLCYSLTVSLCLPSQVPAGL